MTAKTALAFFGSISFYVQLLGNTILLKAGHSELIHETVTLHKHEFKKYIFLIPLTVGNISKCTQR